MVFEMTLTNVLTVMSLFCMAMWAILKAIAMQAQKRSDEKFDQLQKSLMDLTKAVGKESEQLRSLEMSQLRFQAEVARDYVRRDDFVQVIATINTRIDNFALRIEAAVLNLPGGKSK
ncbi:MAG: hypothetical protein RR473_13835 [Comamonas sp.]